MNRQVLDSAKFDVKIKTKGIDIDKKSLSYKEAYMLVESTVKANPDFEKLQEYWEKYRDQFGFVGFSGPGYNITINAYRDHVELKDEKQTCPRRGENFHPVEENLDYWEMRGDDKCCSYCGSIHPDRVIELVKELGPGIIEGTTKSYKRYLSRPNVPNAAFGGIKFYTMHFSKEQIDQFNELIGATKKTS